MLGECVVCRGIFEIDELVYNNGKVCCSKCHERIMNSSTYSNAENQSNGVVQILNTEVNEDDKKSAKRTNYRGHCRCNQPTPRGYIKINHEMPQEYIRMLQLTALVKFFECAMYQKYQAEWKLIVTKKVKVRCIEKRYSFNYRALLNTVGYNCNFNTDVLDLTTTISLICYDFLDDCCAYKNLNKEELRTLIHRIRSDRNELAHTTFDCDEYRLISSAVNHLENFILFLEQNDWKYEASASFLEYLRAEGRFVDSKVAFLDEIKMRLLEYKKEVSVLARSH